MGISLSPLLPFRTMRKQMAFCGLLFLLILAPTLRTAAADAAPASVGSLFDDPVLVRGKGLEVKRSQREDAFTAYAANLAARGETMPPDERSFREAQLLDRLIITRLLVGRAVDQDKERAKQLCQKFIKEAQRATSSEEM